MKKAIVVFIILFSTIPAKAEDILPPHENTVSSSKKIPDQNLLADQNQSIFKNLYLDGIKANSTLIYLQQIEDLIKNNEKKYTPPIVNYINGWFGIQPSYQREFDALINMLAKSLIPDNITFPPDSYIRITIDSLPKLYNKPEENLFIIDNWRKAVQYRQGISDIASHVLNNEYSPADAFMEIRTLESNLGLNNLRGSGSLSQSQGTQPVPSQGQGVQPQQGMQTSWLQQLQPGQSIQHRGFKIRRNL